MSLSQITAAYLEVLPCSAVGGSDRHSVDVTAVLQCIRRRCIAGAVGGSEGASNGLAVKRRLRRRLAAVGVHAGGPVAGMQARRR